MGAKHLPDEATCGQAIALPSEAGRVIPRASLITHIAFGATTKALEQALLVYPLTQGSMIIVPVDLQEGGKANHSCKLAAQSRIRRYHVVLYASTEEWQVPQPLSSPGRTDSPCTGHNSVASVLHFASRGALSRSKRSTGKQWALFSSRCV